MDGCRGVAGKPAAAARIRDAKQSSSATQYSYLSTGPSSGPSPRDMGVHAPAECRPRRVGGRNSGPEAPPASLRSGRRREKHETPARRVIWRSGWGRSRLEGKDRGLLDSLAIPPPRLVRPGNF